MFQVIVRPGVVSNLTAQGNQDETNRWVFCCVERRAERGCFRGSNDRFAPVFEGGGIEVYLKMDFDEGDNPFTSQGKGEVAISNRHAVSGRSLHVRRTSPSGYFGGHTSKVAVRTRLG